MNTIFRISGKISLLSYVFLLYQVWHLCQYGGVRSHFIRLLPAALVFLISAVLWIILKRRRRKEAHDGVKHQDTIRRTALWAQGIFVFVLTVYFAGRIIYAAIPYHGALSWKLDEWMRQKEVRLYHNNLFADGVEGILEDLDNALDMPEELYIANQFQVAFDEKGVVDTLYTFLYGQEEDGDTRTYLVDYDADRSENMTVWVDGEAAETYDEAMSLAPMLVILQEAPWKTQVDTWSAKYGKERYELLYYGKRSFPSADGLQYLPGDVDGDGKDTGGDAIARLSGGGEAAGYEVSLHIPAKEEITPVRYIMEPEYVSQEALDAGREQRQEETAKESESWTVDNSDGAMYFFLDDSNGWRLKVADAAAGSRFYQLERTKDGGGLWEMVNEDPFGGRLGAAEGMVFYDENFGIAGLTGASQSASRLYMTKDGGASFTEITMPVDSAARLPETASDLGLTAKDYDYLYMPEKKGEVLQVLAVTDAGEQEGILFQSSDGGETWTWAEE
ncbi:MAG: WD40/YVTN/BNR-like repeat-containing protein [Ruminococcus sp.]